MNLFLAKANKPILSIREGSSQEIVEHNVKHVLSVYRLLLILDSEFLDATQRAKFPTSFYFEASEACRFMCMFLPCSIVQLWVGEKDEDVIAALHHICRKLRDYDVCPYVSRFLAPHTDRSFLMTFGAARLPSPTPVRVATQACTLSFNVEPNAPTAVAVAPKAEHVEVVAAPPTPKAEHASIDKPHPLVYRQLRCVLILIDTRLCCPPAPSRP